MKKKVLCVIIAALMLLIAVPTYASVTNYAGEWENFPVLKKGKEGYPVRALQRVLLSTYSDCYNTITSNGGVDGNFGNGTRAAVIQFQNHKSNLSADGVVGQNTWHELSNYVYFYNEYIGGYPVYDVYTSPTSAYTLTLYRRMSSTHWQYRNSESSSWHNIVNN